MPNILYDGDDKCKIALGSADLKVKPPDEMMIGFPSPFTCTRVELYIEAYGNIADPNTHLTKMVKMICNKNMQRGGHTQTQNMFYYYENEKQTKNEIAGEKTILKQLVGNIEDVWKIVPSLDVLPEEETEE